jgi:putative CocE/NonD family hydrolase
MLSMRTSENRLYNTVTTVTLLKNSFLIWGIFAMVWAGCTQKPDTLQGRVDADSLYVVENFQKYEYQIPMRDGVKLFTAVYVPKDKTQTYPILLQRTCYSVAPYGEEVYPKSLGPSPYLMREGYIIVRQDVRGRWMSEGTFDNMRPHIPGKSSVEQIDESSDTYDTIEWLLNNVEGHNGRVGMWGISYPGFYTIAGAVEAHPALKASSPQAPIADFFFDDFHHHGAYMLSYWRATPVFGYQKDAPTTEAWYKMPDFGTPDGYQFFMDMGPLASGSKPFYGDDNFFWQELVEHPNYDEFWQKRSILPHLNNIGHAVMTVGGWFDAEDLYGPLSIYKTIEKNNPSTYNTLVMGPWSHGDWARERGIQAVGNVYFGDSLSTFYQRFIELPFFNHYLKGEGDGKTGLPEAYVFDTGKKTWAQFETWPPQGIIPLSLHLHPGEKLKPNQLQTAPVANPGRQFFEFVSDPEKPVPYNEDIEVVFTPRKYMTDDQRFAGRRPDVLVFQTPVLTEDVTLLGSIMAKLDVSTTGTDADWIVKLIDVYPNDHPDFPHNPRHIRMGGYQQMVRSEMFRGRFRESYEKPMPFKPGQVTRVNVPLQDIFHTFKKGHRIMVQIQSTSFPLIDRNPQTFVENIFKAKPENFVKATHRVFASSVIEFEGVLSGNLP